MWAQDLFVPALQPIFRAEVCLHHCPGVPAVAPDGLESAADRGDDEAAAFVFHRGAERSKDPETGPVTTPPKGGSRRDRGWDMIVVI